MDEKARVREVAELFFYTYIVDADRNSEAIDAIAELIGYGGDIELIKQKMALEIDA